MKDDFKVGDKVYYIGDTYIKFNDGEAYPITKIHDSVPKMYEVEGLYCFSSELARVSERECSEDMVNHPPHYKAHPSGVECIEITEHMGFCVGNAMKYLWRADEKHDDGGLEDLKKAAWYIQREIDRRTDG